MNTYITVYTEKNGRQEFTQEQWENLGFEEWEDWCPHRIDGFALEYNCGAKHWYINGIRHREDGPAIEWIDENEKCLIKRYYINGQLHREDGPAIEQDNGSPLYFLGNKEYGYREYWNTLLEISGMDPVLQLIDPREWVRKKAEKFYKDKI